MRGFTLLFLTVFCILLLATCSNKPGNPKLKGNWQSKDGTTLKITAKQFTIADSDQPVAEDYFIKGDTIFTSFEGNQPYTKFVIQKLDDHNLSLLFPDSVTIAFTR